jgi:hypothetical protein
VAVSQLSDFHLSWVQSMWILYIFIHCFGNGLSGQHRAYAP